MPTYEFKNKDTGEVFEKMMSYEKKVEYLKDNPNIQSHYTTLNIIMNISKTSIWAKISNTKSAL